MSITAVIGPPPPLLTATSIAIAVLTWFGGHTLYNRFFLGRRGLEQFPFPSCECRKPKVQLQSTQEERPRASRWAWKRRSQRSGYSHLPTEHDEEEALASRFSLADDDDDDHDDARALGGEVDAWRGHGHGGARSSEENGESRVGVHQGLVNL